MIKCLLSYEASHYVVYLKASANAGWLSFDEARAYLSSHYDGLVKSLSLDFERDKFEIFDSDFGQYVIVDQCTRIGNLCKLKVTKPATDLRQAGLDTQLVAVNNCFNSCMNSCINGCPAKVLACANGRMDGLKVGRPCEYEQSKRLSQDLGRSNDKLVSFDRINTSDELNSTKDTSKSGGQGRENNKGSGREPSKDNGLDRRRTCTGPASSRGTPIQPIRNVSLSASKESTPLNAADQQLLMNSSCHRHTSPRSPSSSCSNCSHTFADATVVYNSKLIDARAGNETILSGSNAGHSKGRQSVQCQTLDTERRIIHLRENPFRERCLKLRADYGRLIEDNKRLAAKLELYKQGSVANATSYLDDFVSNADTIERLQKELAEAKDEQKTIMEAFKKKSKEFRRVVYLLTGFKFDALEQRKYRVSHVYANPNDYLFFTFEKEEVINLLGNEFSEQFIDLIKTYLVQYGSYPSFLASITIKLFKETPHESSKKQIG